MARVHSTRRRQALALIGFLGPGDLLSLRDLTANAIFSNSEPSRSIVALEIDTPGNGFGISWPGPAEPSGEYQLPPLGVTVLKKLAFDAPS